MSVDAPVRGLALDHLTVIDTTPSQLVEVAAAVDARAVCLFMEPMGVLPRLPSFALYGDVPERRETKARLDHLGIEVDLVYPFTLSGRSQVGTFRTALETAAWLGARAVNVLLYDREPARRLENFSEFCTLALDHGLQVVVEFFPASQVRTLAEACDLVAHIAAPGRVGVNADLLHLARSGGSIAQLAATSASTVLYAQLCDAPYDCPVQDRDAESRLQRLLPGEGALNVREFAAAFAPEVRMSVEVPQESAIVAGKTAIERARIAFDRTRRELSTPRKY